MALKDYSWKPVYNTSENNFHREFFIPALERSIKYDRGVGYFTSGWIRNAAIGIAHFAKNGGRARWITSPILNQHDYRILAQVPPEQVESELARIMDLSVEELAQNIELDTRQELGRLISAGIIDIRLALPIGELHSGDFHDKFGVFTDKEGNRLSFNGSYNDSQHADLNYESIKTFPSWVPFVGDFVADDQARFDRLWVGSDPRVRIYNLPSAIREKIVKFQEHRRRISAPDQVDEDQPLAADSQKYQQELWNHQKQAFEAFLSNGGRGLVEMATGTGKTRLALALCEKYIHSGIVESIIVTADGTDLLDQWYLQLLDLADAAPQPWSILRHYADHKDGGDYRGNPRRKILLTSREFLPLCIKRLPREALNATFLIHDEVHKLGSASNRRDLAGHGQSMGYVLGLSATPDREYDEDGNTFIKSEIGPTVFQFGLEQAIRNGVLCPLNYTPLDYVANEEDKSALQAVYRKRAARAASGNPMSQTELWIELSRVYKRSKAKLLPFSKYVQDNPGILKNCIIFVEDTEYGSLVMDIVHRHSLDFRSYFAEEDKSTLEAFAKGDITCLITCHRLSEGIDIRSLENVILFSSARAKLETIQRIGRCLRIDPNRPEKVAHVLDFTRVSEDPGEEDPQADSNRKKWLNSLSEIKPLKK
jgi:superfamily II DNA or RNA helicase